MNDEVKMDVYEPDPETNTRTAVLTMPANIAPQTAIKMIHNAVWGEDTPSTDDHLWKKGTNMDHDDIKIEFSEADLDTNMQKVTIQAPTDVDLEFARQVFYNAVWGGASRIEEENK